MQPLLHGKPPCLSEKAAETTSPAAVGSAVKESVQGKPRHWAKVVAGFPAPALAGERILDLGATGATLPAETCSGNRLYQIALRSQFGHWALRSEGAWGYRVSLPTPVTQPRLAHDWRGFFMKSA